MHLREGRLVWGLMLVVAGGCEHDPESSDAGAEAVEGRGSANPGEDSSEGNSDGEAQLAKVIITPTGSDAPTLPPIIITPAGAGPIAPPPAVCGDGVVQDGEVCDSGGCCADDCGSFVAAGTECRAAEGDCDVAEACTGEDAACPDDAVASWETMCRESSGEVCDAPEHCDGKSKACPADSPAPAGTVCGQPSMPCDAPELCDGQSKSCPPATISVADAGTVCRPATDACDAVETCDGLGLDCPADGVEGTTHVCRPVSGVCDVAETCDGVAKQCPADQFGIFRTACRPLNPNVACDAAEFCDGTGPDCPADGYSKGNVCRAAVPGTCDVEETCSGKSPDCPADAYAPDGASCNGGLGKCSFAVCCPGVTSVSAAGGLCSLGSNENLVFVTSSTTKGDITVGGADKLCNTVAASANLEGSFHAWLSNAASRTGGDARDRVGQGPYVRVDGVTFADSLATLTQGSVQNPLNLTEWGATLDTGVWTGTSPTGVMAVSAASGAALVCSDWTDATSKAVGQAGLSVTNKPNWTADSAQSCDTALSLYCFADDQPLTVSPLVFVTGGFTYLGDGLGGLTSGDAMCNSAARQAGISRHFVAWMSDSSTNARDRIPDRAYYRYDGKRVAASLKDLTDGTLENPISLDENGAVVMVAVGAAPIRVWTGTNPSGVASNHCKDWTPSDSSDGDQGDPSASDSTWTELTPPAPCRGPGRLYCFQDD